MASVGGKYERGMDTAEIAKRIRGDIKAAQKSGALPASMKVSVRIRRFAGGSSIDVRVDAVPFQIHASNFVAFEVRTGGRHSWDGERFTARARATLEALESIVAAYNREDNDTQTDYFNTNFYSSTQFSMELRDEDWNILAEYHRALPTPHLRLVG